jgi:hypothetical protein
MQYQRTLYLVTLLAVGMSVIASPLLAQNLGTAPAFNAAVQGQTADQPEGAFLNIVNWVGNVIAPVGAALAVVGAVVSYMSGRGYMRYGVTAIGLLPVSGLTRLVEYWITNGAAIS